MNEIVNEAACHVSRTECDHASTASTFHFGKLSACGRMGVWAYGRGRQPVLESADLIKNAKLFRQWGTGSGKVEGMGGPVN